ncbi:MAG: tRNA (adenosine(37)-N6)-dimethylallyltransferase MiaA [Fluviicola sp.]
MEKQLIVIEGPTASGKTSLAVELAKHFKTVVLSSDSRQFYKEMSIGTAKPSIEEMDGIKHYFIDSHSLQEPITAGKYEKQALEILEEEFKIHNKIILVGGSGMFTNALCNGLDNIPVFPEIQLELRNELEEFGSEKLLEELQASDFEYFENVDKSNNMRILRALEVIRGTGSTFTSLRKNSSTKRPFEVKRFVINHDRTVLYDRINLRVDLMLKNGLLEEVKQLENFRNLAPLQTVGYSEVFDYFDGKCSLEECIDKIKQHTRNYAKRQLTWFKRNPDSNWIDFTSNSEMKNSILKLLEYQV